MPPNRKAINLKAIMLNQFPTKDEAGNREEFDDTRRLFHGRGYAKCAHMSAFCRLMHL